ncbi:MAG: T9SS type A sorting domain-containing protein [Bacteroidota bacterium]|nr:T9SS type A sorting domain-containing protein [Bacteroidota bacterium]
MKPVAALCIFFNTVICLLLADSSAAQMVPVSLDQRAANSSVIAIVRLKEQKSYWDSKKENIYTRNVLLIKAYLKGATASNTIVAISPGGIVDNHAEYVCPAETYEPGKDYLVLLKADDHRIDDKSYRADHPEIPQCLSYAGVQSVLPYEEGVYKDALAEPPMTEEQLLNRMRTSYGLTAKQPDGSAYTARIFIPAAQRITATITSITDGTGSLPASGFVNGTIPAGNELIINGSGFGTITGSVQFTTINAASGFVSTGPQDTISWTDTKIRVKIPDLAGTGTFNVLDNTATIIASGSITIKWGEINITQSFLNFSSVQRQQVRLMNLNSQGGYTFEYSSNTGSGPAFSADAAARGAFERAVRTWRCNTLVNFNVQSLTSNSAGFANDGVNIVMYDNVMLPAGALGVCTSRFNASGASGLCDLFNTVWYLQEMDIRVLSVPVPGFTWNFTTGAPTASQYDFESVMLHEVGHGHGLSHINLPSTLMYFAISNGATKRVPSANEIQMGQYRITVSNANCLNTNGFAGFAPHQAISAGSCMTLLPVTLLDFSGEKHARAINLQWITEQEQNFKGYYVERSTDGQNFNPIGFVRATGGSTSRQTYTFTDNDHFPVLVYYRLRMEDMDNKYTYSRIISFTPDNASWKLFPNPADDKVYIVPGKSYTGTVLLQVNDLSGRTILSQQLTQISPGIAVPINTKNLIPGIYILKIASGNEILMLEKLDKK